MAGDLLYPGAAMTRSPQRLAVSALFFGCLPLAQIRDPKMPALNVDRVRGPALINQASIISLAGVRRTVAVEGVS